MRKFIFLALISAVFSFGAYRVQLNRFLRPSICTTCKNSLNAIANLMDIYKSTNAQLTEEMIQKTLRNSCLSNGRRHLPFVKYYTVMCKHIEGHAKTLIEDSSPEERASKICMKLNFCQMNTRRPTWMNRMSSRRPTWRTMMFKKKLLPSMTFFPRRKMLLPFMRKTNGKRRHGFAKKIMDKVLPKIRFLRPWLRRTNLTRSFNHTKNENRHLHRHKNGHHRHRHPYHYLRLLKKKMETKMEKEATDATHGEKSIEEKEEEQEDKKDMIENVFEKEKVGEEEKEEEEEEDEKDMIENAEEIEEGEGEVEEEDKDEKEIIENEEEKEEEEEGEVGEEEESEMMKKVEIEEELEPKDEIDAIAIDRSGNTDIDFDNNIKNFFNNKITPVVNGEDFDDSFNTNENLTDSDFANLPAFDDPDSFDDDITYDADDTDDDGFTDLFVSSVFNNLFNYDKEKAQIFNFELPSMPKIPKIPSLPKMPKIPKMPSLPKMPKMEVIPKLESMEIPKLKFDTDFMSGFFGNPFSTGTIDDIFDETNKMLEDVMKTTKKTISVIKRFTSSDNLKCKVCDTITHFIAMGVESLEMEELKKTLENKCNEDSSWKDVCEMVINNLDNIIELAKNKTESAQICEMIGIKNCTNDGNYMKTSVITSTTFYEDKPTCDSMCQKMKDQLSKSNEETQLYLTDVENKLKQFCAENGVTTKCDTMLRMLGKVSRNVEKLSAPVSFSDDGKCSCFDEQITTNPDSTGCDICKMFEEVLMEKLNATMLTVDILANVLEEKICPYFPQFQDQCTSMVEELRTLFDVHVNALNGVCEKIGVCKKNSTSDFNAALKATVESFNQYLMPGLPLLLRGAPLGLMNSQFSMGCNFCKACLKNIETTANTMNSSEMKTFMPIMKDTFGFICSTDSTNDGIKTVCKTLTDEMDTITKNIMQKESPNDVCKGMELC